MNLFVARQPIFDAKLRVFAYELLYREGLENRYSGLDADEASSRVMVNSFTNLGIESLTGGRLAFVNFTARLVREQVATLFPADLLVVELLEDIDPDSGLVDAIGKLREAGYCIALDDFIFRPGLQPFLALADIIKVDFRLTVGAARRDVIRRFGNGRIRFLAEKVESQEEFEQAKAMGYTLFQGFFFSKPVISPMGEVPAMRMNQLRLLELINRPEADYGELSGIVGQDVSLSYKLLRLVNSSVFGRRVRIESIRHALVMLGMNELRKWLSLLLMRGIADGKPTELVRLSLVRARMLEAAGRKLGLRKELDELFLLGLFSCLDVMMERPLDELLTGLAVPMSIKDGLLRKEGMHGFLYQLVLAHEAGDWDEVTRLAPLLGLDPGLLSTIYCEALAWCAELLKNSE